MIDAELLETISMQIILHAGDARKNVLMALNAAADEDYPAAQEAFAKADIHIEQAHLAQTDMIQKSLEEEHFTLPNFLFIHAQDTLMTIMSEVNMGKAMVRMHQSISNKTKQVTE